MISQPMRGLDDAEIDETRMKAKEFLEGKGYEVVDTIFDFNHTILSSHGVESLSLYCLGQSLCEMSKCNTVYFLKGWEEARGCRIEHEAAQGYGLICLYE